MAVLPDGLSSLVEWAVKLSFLGDIAKAWFITGQAGNTGSTADVAYGQAEGWILGLVDALKIVPYNPVHFHGGWVRRYTPKTIEPNPDPPVYNPSNHITIAASAVGQREWGATELMFYDQVLDVLRTPQFGNVGRIEFRGALTEADVTETLMSKILAAPSTFDDIITEFADTIAVLQGDTGLTMMMAGEPLMDTIRSTVDNVHYEVQTFGETVVREVVGWGRGAVRSDKGKSAWFNSSRVGG